MFQADHPASTVTKPVKEVTTPQLDLVRNILAHICGWFAVDKVLQHPSKWVLKRIVAVCVKRVITHGDLNQGWHHNECIGPEGHDSQGTKVSEAAA